MSNSKLLTIQQAADYLNISRRQFMREIVDKGKIQILDLGPRTRRIPADELETFIRKNAKCLSAKGENSGSSMSRSDRSELERLCGARKLK